MALRFLIDEAAVHETSTGDSPRHNRAPSGVPGGTMARDRSRVLATDASVPVSGDPQPSFPCGILQIPCHGFCEIQRAFGAMNAAGCIHGRAKPARAPSL
jgi:hypothetical protein